MFRTTFLNLGMSIVMSLLGAVAPFLLGWVWIYIIRSIGMGLLEGAKGLFWWSIIPGAAVGFLSIALIFYYIYQWKLGAANEVSDYWTNRKRPMKIWSVIICLLPILAIFGVGVYLVYDNYSEIITYLDGIVNPNHYVGGADLTSKYALTGAIIIAIEAVIMGFLGYFCMMCCAYADITCHSCFAVGGIGFDCAGKDSKTAIVTKANTSREKVGTISSEYGGSVDVFGDITRYRQEEVTTTTSHYSGNCVFCRQNNNRTKVSVDSKEV